MFTSASAHGNRVTTNQQRAVVFCVISRHEPTWGLHIDALGLGVDQVEHVLDGAFGLADIWKGLQIVEQFVTGPLAGGRSGSRACRVTG